MTDLAIYIYIYQLGYPALPGDFKGFLSFFSLAPVSLTACFPVPCRFLTPGRISAHGRFSGPGLFYFSRSRLLLRFTAPACSSFRSSVPPLNFRAFPMWLRWAVAECCAQSSKLICSLVNTLLFGLLVQLRLNFLNFNQCSLMYWFHSASVIFCKGLL